MQFQRFDELPSDEYAALKADIAKRGVLVPIELDENGNILDGHHRKQAVDELGIKDYPTVVRRFASDDEKEEHVVTLNVRRRHLTSEQKRKWAEWFLRRHPEWTDRRVASEVGLSHPTVAKVREELESDGELVKFTSRVGKDGKARPSEQPKPKQQPAIFVPAKQAPRAQAALSNLGDEAPPRQLDVKRAERMAREKEAERRRSEPVEPVTVTTGIDIRHGAFREVLAHDMPANCPRRRGQASMHTADACKSDPCVSLFNGSTGQYNSAGTSIALVVETQPNRASREAERTKVREDAVPRKRRTGLPVMGEQPRWHPSV